MQPIQFFAARAEDGALVPGATVDVFVSGTPTRAALFVDSLGSVPLGNPFHADKNARVFFYTSSNRIDVHIHRGGYSAPLIRDIVVTDPDDVLALTNGVYRSVAQGLAATTSGKIFQVLAPEDEAAYAIYENINGVAVDTGKRIPTRYLLDRVEHLAQQYADDAEAFSEASRIFAEGAMAYAGRNFGPLTADPVTNPLGQPLAAGDRYFNTALGIERVYSGLAWLTPNADGQQIQQYLADPNDPGRGAGMVGFKRAPLTEAMRSVGGMLSGQELNVWEFMPIGVTYAPTSDPATWPDIAPAISAASAYLSTQGGGRLTVPKGRYRLNSAVSSTPNVLVDFNFSVIYYYGAGRAISIDCGTANGGGIQNAWIEAMGSAQDGVYVQGSFPIVKNLFLRNFEGVSLRVGDITVAGAQWGDFHQIQVWNQWGQPGGKRGNVAILVDGGTAGLNPNSNLNRFREIMVSGGFNIGCEDRGVDNKWDGINIAWRVGSTMTMFRATNSGATIDGLYVESSDGTLPNRVLHFTNTSARIHVRRPDFVFSPGVGKNMESFILDVGYANVYSIPARGIDLGGTGSPLSPGVNLFGNGYFQTWQSATTPHGGRSASPTITKGALGYAGGGRSVQFNDLESNSSISFDITPSGSSVVNLPLAFLKGKTLTATSVVTANYQGPMFKIFAGPGNTASTGEHSGDGKPVSLAATIKIDDAATSVFIQFRSNNAGGGVNTGTANFGGVVLVMGDSVPRDLVRSIPESGGIVAGDLDFKYDAVTFADSAFERHSGFYHWADTSGNLRKSPTRPTVQNSGDSAAHPVFVGGLECGGPLKMGQYTLATLPSASAYNSSLIIVTDATGGAKLCRSNGSVWQITNTTTTVS